MTRYPLLNPRGRFSTSVRSNQDKIASMIPIRVPGMLINRGPRGISMRPIGKTTTTKTTSEARWA